MEIKIKSYSSQSSLINSIIFFIIGGILFTSAEKILSFASISIGIILAIAGIFELVIYGLSVKKEKPNKKFLPFGVICLILSIIFIFFHDIVEQFIRFIIGGWILFAGIMRLINTLSMSLKNTKFLPLLVVALLLIGVGIYTIVIGDIVLSTIGIIMMVYAAIDIAGYIFYTKDKQEKEEEGVTSLIIPEQDEEDNDKKDKKKQRIKDIEEENDNKDKKNKK